MFFGNMRGDLWIKPGQPASQVIIMHRLTDDKLK